MGVSIAEDESQFPLIRITFCGVATDAEFRSCLEHQTTRIQRRTLNAILIDASDAGPTPPIQRKMQAAHRARGAHGDFLDSTDADAAPTDGVHRESGVVVCASAS